MKKTFCICASVLGITTTALAQAWQQEARLQPSDATQGFVQFGTAVALHDNMAVVGSLWWDGVGDDNFGSSVRIYMQEFPDDTWLEAARLVAPEEAVFGDNEFGAALAMNEHWLVVGAPRHGLTVDDLSGAVFVYARVGDDWAFHSKLTPSDGEPNDQFGTAVSLLQHTIAIGALNHDPGITDAGAVYVFSLEDSIWVEQQKLLPPSATENARFGNSLALDDRGLIVGEVSGVVDERRSGAAYWFESSGGMWTLVQRVIPPIVGNAFAFGASVGIQDARMVVTAPGIRFGGLDTGRAFAYSYDGTAWSHDQTFNDPTKTRGFGESLAMEHDLLAVSIVDGTDGGAIAMFRLRDNAWTVVDRLQANDGAIGDGLGAGLAIDAGRVMAGANGVDTDLSNLGAAYIFNPNTCPPDLDADGELTIFDFLAFQNAFDAMDPAADFDGDGDFTIFDFLAFQNAFDAGCP